MSIGFSDIKHGNEHSLFFCANLKSLLIFKNMHIYGQGESLQSLLIDECFDLFTSGVQRENGFGAGEGRTAALPSPVCLTACHRLEWTQS